jgi:hypothetical protein
VTLNINHIFHWEIWDECIRANGFTIEFSICMRNWLYPYWLIVQHDHNLVLLNFLLGNRILKVATVIVLSKLWEFLYRLVSNSAPIEKMSGDCFSAHFTFSSCCPNSPSFMRTLPQPFQSALPTVYGLQIPVIIRSTK